MVEKGAMVTEKILALKTYSNQIKSQGFSLIEILIVLALLAGLVAVASSQISFRKENLQSALRSMATLSREVKHQSKSRQTLFRIRFDLESTPQRYWIETSNQDSPKIETDEDSSDENEAQSSFQKDTTLLKKEKLLPENVIINSITTLSQDKSPNTSQEEKEAYIYYWPNGLNDSAVILVSTKSSADSLWSLVINPLTGRGELFKKEIKLEETLSP